MNGITPATTPLVTSPKQKLLFGGARALDWSVHFWFLVTLIGQWIFAWYIVSTYWLPQDGGSQSRWDSLEADYGFAFLAHVGLAIGIFAAGPLQLIPQLRARFPRFHRWSGRVYLVSVAIASAGGLYMIWVHSDVGGVGVQLGTSISALLAAFFGWRAISFARAHKFNLHRRYALRLFIAGASVWFFRIQLMLWLMISGGKGIDPETFHGPALVVVSFTQYLVPLLVLELYFVAAAASNRKKMAFATLLTVLTLVMALGLYVTTISMWFPSLATTA